MRIADRRTKIVATLGPATSDESVLRSCFQSGLNVARLNFSHGDFATHSRSVDMLRKISRDLKAPIAILQDLQGPKIRVGELPGGSIELVKNAEHIFYDAHRASPSGSNLIPCDSAEWMDVVQPGHRVLLDDGLLEVEVLRIREKGVVEVGVIHGGNLKSRKGINLPGVPLPNEPMTEKDHLDLRHGVTLGVDYVALSFVRRGDDVRDLRTELKRLGSSARIIAKIEMLEALDEIEEIVRLSDAVMVARGDLAIEVGHSRLPLIQKKIIQVANQLGRAVITATQMLESMRESPRPTRAEITDVANAVLDGSDALMLSAETASGKFPSESIRIMHDIIMNVEREGAYGYDSHLAAPYATIPEAVGAAAALTAQKISATAIVSLTTTGGTAAMVSGYRPRARIIAATHIMSTLNRLELNWGVQTLLIQPYDTLENAIRQIETQLLQNGLARPGEKIVLTLGSSLKEKGSTDTLRVIAIGREDVLLSPDLPLRFKDDMT